MKKYRDNNSVDVDPPSSASPTPPKYLTDAEVTERYRGLISIGTLRNWRTQRIGPPYVKVGKAVLYSVGDLDAWDLIRTIRNR